MNYAASIKNLFNRAPAAVPAVVQVAKADKVQALRDLFARAHSLRGASMRFRARPGRIADAGSGSRSASCSTSFTFFLEFK